MRAGELWTKIISLMNRIEQKFAELRAKNQPALILYLSAGDPNLDTTEKLILALEQAGADIIELGVPFSDPMADGPTIQSASERALKNYFTLEDIFAMAERIRSKSQIPLLLFSYYNPIFKFGEERAVSLAQEAGIDGMLVVDLPPEESENLGKLCADYGLSLVHLATPTSTPERLKLIAQASSGFIYYVSVTGVTGAREQLPEDLIEHLRLVKKFTDLPIAVGFGISRSEQAKELGRIADAVVVGSALVKLIEKYSSTDKLFEEVKNFARSLKSELEKSRS